MPGADQAVRTALEDERVTGIVLVDGYAYRTRRFLLQHYSGRVMRPSSWWNILSLQHPGYARLAKLFELGRTPLHLRIAFALGFFGRSGVTAHPFIDM